MYFILEFFQVGDMFQHVGTEHDIEGRVTKRDGVAIVIEHREDALFLVVAAAQINGIDVKPLRLQRLGLPAGAGANFQQPAAAW